MPVSRSVIRTQGEAEASRAVADLKQAVRAQEGISLAPSQVIHRLQVIINRDVAQLLPTLQPPPPPQEDYPCHQHQHQDSQDAGDGEGGRGGLGGLAQGWFETGLECELATRAHEALRALTNRACEVGEASSAVLAWKGTTGI